MGVNRLPALARAVRARTFRDERLGAAVRRPARHLGYRRRPGWQASLGLILGLSASVAQAISLYDVIQLSRAGKSDAEIIDLLQTTQARFTLDAGSVTELKKAGVSEKVIQAIIQAGPPEQEEDPAASAPSGPGPPGPPSSRARADEAERAAPEHETIEPAAGSSRHRRPSAPVARPDSRGAEFTAFPFEETGSGHGGGHDHFAVALGAAPVLVLRSEAGHRSVAGRAEAAVDRLNRAAEAPGGRFFPAVKPHAGVNYRSPSGEVLEVLDVSRGDVLAYQRRSLGQVSPGRLAAYWAALLNDYTGLFAGESPAELGKLHLGESLERLHRDLISSEKEDRPANPPGGRFLSVLDHLTSEDKDHLIELATRVPAEFRAPKGGFPP